MISKDTIEYLKSMGLKVFSANYYGESTKVNLQEDFEAFAEIAKDLEIKHVFYNTDSLTEDDIEESLITEEMLMEERIPESLFSKLKKDIEIHNKALMEMKRKIGEEQRIEFFYVSQGAVYKYNKVNPELYPADPDELMEHWLEVYEEEINEIKSKERLEKQMNIQQLLSNSEEVIINHQNFRTCTNAGNRSKFAFELYTDMETELTANDISLHQLQQHINFLWSKHKDSFKKR